MAEKPKLVDLPPAEAITKPEGFSLDKFKSKRTAIAKVETLQTGLPILKIADAKDYVRLHPDEDNYWTSELCFVEVPIKGQTRDTLHLIDEDLAMQYLPSGNVKRFRLALATKPNDAFFLCIVPSQNLDNKFNADAVAACEQAKTKWRKVTSLRDDGVDGYRVTPAYHEDFVPGPKWPSQLLAAILEATFTGRMIDHANHPALLRLIGARQVLG
jgi:hypothetical protein